MAEFESGVTICGTLIDLTYHFTLKVVKMRPGAMSRVSHNDFVTERDHVTQK